MSDLINTLKKDTHYIEGLSSCMNCGVCTAICPAAEFYNYDPRKIVDAVQRDDEQLVKELLFSEEIWYCGECMSCKTRCPRGNTPGLVIMALRKLSQEHGAFVESEKGRQQYAIKKVIDTNILERGYCLTPDLVVPENHPEQGPMWKWVYSNMEDVYDRVSANLGKPGSGVLRKIDDESLHELHSIFEVTGAMDFINQIQQFSEAKAKEDGMDMDTYFNTVYSENNGTHSGN